MSEPTYEDRMVPILEGRVVGEDPNVAAELARAMVLEFGRQMNDVPPDKRVHAVTLTLGLRVLAVRVRAFGPSKAAREMHFRTAKLLFADVAKRALERCGR
jgi:hypothetical protein